MKRPFLKVLIIILMAGVQANFIFSQNSKPVSNIITFFIETKKANEFVGAPDIRVAYLGWNTVSDKNGQVILPQRETKKKANILVTTAIKPVLFNDNFVSHFVVDAPALFHKISFVKGAKNMVGKWKQEIKYLKKYDRIPDDSIIIFAEPNLVKITESGKSKELYQNLVLPDIYIDPSFIKRNLDINLRFIEASRYFDEIKIKKRYTDNRVGFLVGEY